MAFSACHLYRGTPKALGRCFREEREEQMPYIVTDNCNGCRFTDCVEVCPVDCFHSDEKMLYIDPDECIDCGACEPECPVQAIFEETSVPSEKEEWIQINADKAADLPVITEKQEPLSTASDRKAELGF